MRVRGDLGADADAGAGGAKGDRASDAAVARDFAGSADEAAGATVAEAAEELAAATVTGGFAERLLAWFELHGRKNLPWQRNPTAYRVWVSEVMLQQTQVATVIPYFERFMARFPDVRALAEAPLDEVLHLWTGLGYYARARNLWACAKVLVAGQSGEFPASGELRGTGEFPASGKFSPSGEFPPSSEFLGTGEFPASIDEVTALPGIGRSTAGAILALSRGERHPILDGNVKRVLARVFGVAGDPTSAPVSAALWALAGACMPAERVHEYTQAIMDLGATLCTRARPACTVCPMTADCVAAREGRQTELPGRKTRRARPSREATVLVAETGRDASWAVLLERRPSSGIWGGLWSLPQFDDEAAALAWCRREIGELAPAVRQPAAIEHAFTHFDLRLNPVRVRVGIGVGAGFGVAPGIRETDDRLWYALRAPPRIGLPQPIRQLFERLLVDAAFVDTAPLLDTTLGDRAV